jgi:hypothetical protein
MNPKKALAPRLYIPLAILSLLSIAGYLISSRLNYGIGFPLDDAWIHQTYARNLGQLGEWAFIPGQPSAGSTSPLWSGLIAAGYILRLGPYIWTFFLGWVTLFGIAVIGMWIYPRLSLKNKHWLWPLALVLIFEWHLVWAAASGMETCLFAGLCLLILASLMAGCQNWLLVGALIGASIWVRPDGLTLLGPAIMTGLFDARSHRQRSLNILALLAGFILFFSPYLFWNRTLSGAWWPNTFYAKQAEYAVELAEPLSKRILDEALLPNVGVGVLLLPGFIYSAYVTLRNRQWGAFSATLWAGGYLILYAMRLPVTYQHGRYVMPMMPVYFIWGFAGIASLIRVSSQKLWQRVLSRAWVVSIGLVCMTFWFQGALAYGRDVAFIESEMVPAARWVATNTPENALIAAHDIGALGYFGDRKLLDMAGLVSPEVIPFIRDESRLREWLDSEKADYLVTFPSWYPVLTRGLEPTYQTGGMYSQAFDGENMAVYRWGLRIR